MKSRQSETSVEASGTMSPRPRMRRWLLVLLGILILVSGMVIGSGMTVIIARKKIIHAIRHPEKVPERITVRLKKKLNLSGDQTEQVKEILTRHLRSIMEIRQETRPRILKELNVMRNEIAKVLNERQARLWRKRFEALMRVLPPPPPPL